MRAIPSRPPTPGEAAEAVERLQQKLAVSVPEDGLFWSSLGLWLVPVLLPGLDEDLELDPWILVDGVAVDAPNESAVDGADGAATKRRSARRSG